MKLLEINEDSFNKIIAIHDSDGGNLINESISKLFDCMNDSSNKYEVAINVAALNKIYSTAIQYITPVIDEIVLNVPKNYNSFTINQYVELVDNISKVNWISPTTGKEHSRCNLSFASKYIHFLSGRKIPIYDSYIWIVMVGYFKQKGNNEYSFSPPVNYKYFYETFKKFKLTFNLLNHSNYEIDKYLWQYGKNMLNDIVEDESVSLNKAKSILKKRINSCYSELDVN